MPEPGMQSLDLFARGKLKERDALKLRRAIVETDAGDGVRVTRDGRTLISFCSNDYLNLSQHPAVKAAAAKAVEQFGAGAGASRLVTGSHPLYRTLEEKLALLKGSEAACVFGSGYLANTGIIPALTGQGDLILLDELSHACIHAGAQLSDGEVRLFRHNDTDHLRSLLERERRNFRHTLIVTEGVFSMDGDLAPLPEISALANRHDAWLMTDDAHGLGVVGEGRGVAALYPNAAPPLQMGTLSKAAGSYGGYLCASQAVIDLLRNRARTFVYSTGLPPASAAAASAALDIIVQEPARVAKVIANARRFTAALGLPSAQSAIVPLIVGEAEAALGAARALEAEGFLVVAIRPPTVPANTARLRFAFTAGHRAEDIDRLAACVRRLGLA